MNAYERFKQIDQQQMAQQQIQQMMMQSQIQQELPQEQKYLLRCAQILQAVVAENPNYKDQVGTVLYDFVQKLAGDKAPKVTGMLIDLPIEDIKMIMLSWELLTTRVQQALELLDRQPAQQDQHQAREIEVSEDASTIGNIDGTSIRGGRGRGRGDASIGRGRGQVALRGGRGFAPLGRGRGEAPMRGGRGEALMRGGRGFSPMRGGRGDIPVGRGRGDIPMRGGRGLSPMRGGRGDAPVGRGRGDVTMARGRGQPSMVRGRGQPFMRGGKGRPPMRGGLPAEAAVLRNKLLTGLQTNSTRRLQKDLKELMDADVPLVGVAAKPMDDNLFVWRANIKGPETSAYYGGVFHMEITFPQNYPVSAPSICMFTDIPHPCVSNRMIKLDMLDNKTANAGWYEGWSPAYSVESILIQLQAFLNEQPRSLRDGIIQNVGNVSDNMSAINVSNVQVTPIERKKFEDAVRLANDFRDDAYGHLGPGTPKPAFHEREADEASFIIMRDPKKMLADELLCYHSRSRMPEVSLGIGVSMSRLPRTGEIRSVTPTLDLLSLRAFTKQKVRKSLDAQRFTHWLPLYFGERQPFEKTIEVKQKGEEESKQESVTIQPRERLIQLLKHSLSFIAKGSTTIELTSEIVLQIMPKLIITHMVEMANERKHISIMALRRLINFIRLFRLTIEIVPGVQAAINDKLREFKENESKRVKDFTASLGDILAISIVSDELSMMDILECYLEEQLDRQAFWILQVVPELDHTDEKYKNKTMTMEDAREEVCFKTGMTGFHITMLFFSLTQMLNEKFNRDFGAFEASLDDNWGCLAMADEDELQQKFKKIQKIDTFQKYYQWIGVECPNSEALQQRLRKAISNSKAKKYHGSSEHMNELPELNEQIKEYLQSDPSPFVHYDEGSKKFVDGSNPIWRQVCMKRFDWVRRFVDQGIRGDVTPAFLASQSDRKEIMGVQKHNSLKDYLLERQEPGFALAEVNSETIYEDYRASFSWRDLYHKLCFEFMLQSFDKFHDFSLFYEYVNKLGESLEVLRVRAINKTKLKSNHYWIMVLMTKLTKLRVLKLHGNNTFNLGPDFFKFLVKGINYMAKEGRQLEKIQMNKLLGTCSDSAENLFPCLQPHKNLVSLDFSHSTISLEDAKAIGKVLADFHQIRELNLQNAGLTSETVKEIADGLMRAKQLEIINLENNRDMVDKVSTVIYNLAFSPKIRHINVSELHASNADMAEALMKLIKISGAIETLNLKNTQIGAYLTEDFFKALGESKTLKYLNMDNLGPVQNKGTLQLLGKAIAMNAYRNGALEAVSIDRWFEGYDYFRTYFLKGLQVSERDHEFWYGDRRVAQEMEKDQLVPKMYFNLKKFNMWERNQNKIRHNYKQILKQTKQDWPKILELATKAPLILNMDRFSNSYQDMETIAYMLSDNPYGESKITHLSLIRNSIGKFGAKLLAPALRTNRSLTFLNLSENGLGVSGVVSICSALSTNSTLETLSLYNCKFNVDGARALGTALKTNTSLKFLDLGDNRIRITGLKSITDGILANPGSKVSEMSIKWNFISDLGFTALFEALVLPKADRPQQLKKLWIKNNFLSEFHKIELNNRLNQANLTGQVYVDDFEGVNLLAKEFIDRSIWIAPMPGVTLRCLQTTAKFFEERYNCGFVVDVRMGKGRIVPGRTRDNIYCIVEYAHENSVPRSLKLASKKLAKFNGQPVRIYKAGTKTAVNMPSQQRKRGL